MTRFLGALGVVLTVVCTAAANPASSLGRKISSFTLQDYRGKEYSLEDFSDKEVVVVIFLGTECPLAKLYAPRLEELSKKYADKGVAFVGIDSNRQDSVTEIGHFAKEHGVSFPILKDAGNVVADQFGAERTPEAFVLDKDRAIQYSGRIDDQYGIGATSGYAKTELRKQYMVAAVEDLLAGKPVSEPTMQPPGCLIGRVRQPNESSDVTYSNQISRLFQKHCEECHRPGQIAPFALQDYEEVVGWAEMIQEVVKDQRMPPWHADPKYGHFRNDRSMSPEEKELIYTWVKNGAPKGNPADLPEPIAFKNEWQIPNPDQIFYMADEPYELPATGTLEYEYFEVDPGWKEDKWLKASECRIDNRAVVHHIFVFSIPPGVKVPDFNKNREERRNAAREGRRPARPDDGFNPGTGGIELIAGAAPGTPPWSYGDGMATHLKAGTRLLFQMHYTTNGTVTSDRTAVSFVYADPDEVRNNVRMTMAINPQFVIPPGADAYPVEAFYAFHQDSLVLTMAPHMHLRGKSFRYDLEYPDGRKETILNVPKYDFNWQVIYMNDKPKFIPAGTKMRCQATFDNSVNNLANPDPTQEVKWGDQTWEEMMIGWFAVSDDIDSGSISPEYSRTKRFLAEASEKPVRFSLLLKKSAKAALESPIKMDTLYRQVSKAVPQVDRICISTVSDDKIVFLGAAQPPVLDYAVGRADRSYPAEGADLAKCIESSDVVVHPKLADLTASDVTTMAKRLGSSMHVPVVINGKPATVNFWSREADAFPKPAVDFLTEVAHLISGEKTTVSKN